MAISKKGLRKIVVASQTFYWKFHGKVFVFSEVDKNRRLIIDFGWYDPWLFVNDRENRPPDFEPKVATPKFVQSSILFALEAGWEKEKMELIFRDGNYTHKINPNA